MAPVAEKILVDEEAFTSSLECIDVVEELDRRRAMVAEGSSRLPGRDCESGSAPVFAIGAEHRQEVTSHVKHGNVSKLPLETATSIMRWLSTAEG